jgi:hypothetical protein
VFDVFAPSSEDIADTHDRWIEREPGIWERAVWDEVGRTLTLSVKDEDGGSTMRLAWTTPQEWRGLLKRAGFEVAGVYGWFDRRPYTAGEDTVWVARRL